MSDLVSDGSEFSCPHSPSKLKLKVTSSSSKGDSQKLATKTNCFLLPPGGVCGHPSVAASPPPCPGVPPGNVSNTGQTTVNIDGQPALGKGCQFKCPLFQVPVDLSKSAQTIVKHDTAKMSASSVMVAGSTWAMRAPHPYLKIGLEAAVIVVAGAVLLGEGVKAVSDKIRGNDSASDSSTKTSTAASSSPPPDEEDPEKEDPNKGSDHTKRKIDRYKKKIDSQKEHLTKRDLDAAKRELKGEVVKLKDNGKPFDHVHEVRDAQNGLRKVVESIKNDLGNTSLKSAERQQLEKLMSEASKLLDHSEGFVP